MRVLFIGATGGVGRDVVPLLRASHELTLAALGGGEVDGQPVRDVDITCFASVEQLIAAGDGSGRPFEAVVNCAIADYRSRDIRIPEVRLAYEQDCLRVNAGGAYHIYEASARAGVAKVVYISSMTTFIGHPAPESFDRETRDQPLDIYASCKLFGEHAGRTFAYRNTVYGPPLQVVCLRLGSLHLSGSHWPGYMRNSPRLRALTSDWRDIAQGIDLALAARVQYGVYTIVSAADTTLVQPGLYEELGYKPAWKVTPDGVVPLEPAGG